jgi:hypothetical protein
MSEIVDKIRLSAYERLLRNFDSSQADLLSTFEVAQAAHETGNFTSDAFVRNNNAFGYKPFIGSIWQVIPPPSGANKTYAYFKTVEDSAREVADWIGRRKSSFQNVTTLSAFAGALKANGYYEDKVGNYTSGITFWFNSIFRDGINSVTSLISGDKKKVDVLAIILSATIAFLVTCLLKYLLKKTR